MKVNLGVLIIGFIIGLIAGSIIVLLRASREDEAVDLSQKPDYIPEPLESTAVIADPIGESLAEGKAAARRRRLELGLESQN